MNSEKSIKDQQERRWARWMVAAQEGDQIAYRQLLEEVTFYLEGFMFRTLRHEETAQELIQETLLSLHRARHTYRPEYAFKPWLHTIARHKIIDFYRRRARRPQGTSIEDEVFEIADPKSLEFTEQGFSDEMQKALEQLSENQFKLIQLVKLQGYSIKMASGKMDMSESAVKTALHRAYEKLRKYLREEMTK